MAPSNPAFIFPACPHCAGAVASTDLDEGGVYLVPDVPNPGSTLRVHVRASQVTGDPAARRVAGAPELDRLTLHPCGCTLEGAAVWVFNLAAARLTYPDLRFELRVIVPAPLTGGDAPALYTLSTTTSVDELAASIHPRPLVHRLRGLFDLAEQSLPQWCPPAATIEQEATA